MPNAYHALLLNRQPPPGGLRGQGSGGMEQTCRLLRSMLRLLWPYADLARVHLSISGALLEMLVAERLATEADRAAESGRLLCHLQNSSLFRLLGTMFEPSVSVMRHPQDWEVPLVRWRSIASAQWWQAEWAGFWPPGAGFRMELIPLLRALGYRYVIADSDHVIPVTPMRQQELEYSPHVARWNGAEITVVVCDRDLSRAQQAGLDCEWFLWEVRERTRLCGFPPLVTTTPDPTNGDWLGDLPHGIRFWTGCYLPLLDGVRRGNAEICPIFIDDYLDRFGARGEVCVQANT